MKGIIVDSKELKTGTLYYCLIEAEWRMAFGIVKARYINNAGYPYNHDLVNMEQDIDGVKHRFVADANRMYPRYKKIISAILHNAKQTQHVIEHDKCFDHTNAKEKIESWISTLSDHDQKALRLRFREVYPKLVKPNGDFLGSKFLMKDWRDLMGLYFDYKYPKVEVPTIE